MKTTAYLGTLALTVATSFSWAQPVETGSTALQIQQIRNATVKVSYGETDFLIDPMLAPKGSYPGFEGTFRSELRNPMVELPMPVEEVVADVDAVILTHTHLDHWDETAQQLLPKAVPLFVQNSADAELVRGQGFTDVRILEQSAEFRGVELIKTGGQHGSDTLYAVPAVAQLLGSVMGVVFKTPEQPVVYLAGDTVWRTEVEQTLAQYTPDVVILNTGAAKINGFDNDPILMGREDTLRTHQAAPNARIVAVHMDAVNHMTVDRQALSDYVQQQGLEEQVLIPADGEIIKF